MTRSKVIVPLTSLYSTLHRNQRDLITFVFYRTEML